MTDNRNTILAVILSGLVLIAWQYFYNVPQMEKQRAQSQTQAELAKPTPQATPGSTTPQAGSTPVRQRARQQPAGAGRARRQPRRRDCRHPARQDRHPAPYRQHLAEGRPHRRSLAGAIPRHRRSQIARDRAVSRRRTPQAPITPSSAGSRRAGSTARIPDQNTMWQQEGSGALSPSNPVTLKYDNGEGLTFRRTIAIDDRYLFTIKDDVTNVGNAPVTLYPFALISRHGTPQVSGYYILHEGLIGYLGDKGLQEYGYKKIDDAKSVELQRHQWLARHHRQILGVGAAAGHHREAAGALLVQPGRHGPDLSDRLSAGAADDRDRRHRQRQCAAVRRRQGSQRRRHQFPVRRPRRLQQAARAQPFRSLDRLGLVLLHHQADVPGARLVLSSGRQFRRRHPAGDRAGEAVVLPARQQILRLDGEDEVGAAATAGAEGALSRRPAEAAAGDDGDLQEGEDQPDRRLSSRRLADPGVLLALQGAVRHHRNAPRAVLRLDQGPLGARSDQSVQPVRPVAFRPDDACRCSDITSRSASGRSSWASRCGSR